MRNRSPTTLTIVRRYKNGKVTLRTVNWCATKKVYILRGPVTFVSITYQLKKRPRSKQEKQKIGRRGLRGLLRRILRPV